MRSRRFTMALIAALCALVVGVPATAKDRLKIDPEMFLALMECRSVVEQMPGGFYPGWDFESTPVLFYKPGVQDVLVNFPHVPDGFREFRGVSPLGEEKLYVRDGDTYLADDDQNTILEIDGVTTLVVSDTHSSMRNQIAGVLHSQTPEFVGQWLDEWGFERSPYDLIQTILHEAFHAHQNRLSPDKEADEAVVSLYPVLDVENNALTQLEGRLLSEALCAGDDATLRGLLVEFVAVRRQRHDRLRAEFVEYEHLVEFSEGTAKYIEYRFLKDATDFKARPDMYHAYGFNGYDVLPELFEREMDHLVAATGVPGNRVGNRYGTGPLRFRLYFLGAAQALVLDQVRPNWQRDIFANGVYLSDLLADSMDPGAAELSAALARTKQRHDYDAIAATAESFAAEGEARIQDFVRDILETEKTLVTLDYADLEITGMGYTPFGVTRVRADAAIYDMVPLQIRFGSESLLTINDVQPVLVDRGARTVSFVVAHDPSDFQAGVSEGIEVVAFSLKVDTCQVTIADKHVRIRLGVDD